MRTPGFKLGPQERRRLEALKFVPCYRALWQRIEDRHGRDATLAALKRLRAGPVEDGLPVHKDLEALAGFGPLGPRGPVDPHEPSDVPSGRRWSATATGGPHGPVGVLLLNPQDARDGSPWVRVAIDLSQTWAVIGARLFALRRQLRIKPGRHARERRRWDGPGGWQKAFELLRFARENSETASLRRAASLLDDGHNESSAVLHGRGRQAASRLAHVAQDEVDRAEALCVGFPVMPSTPRFLEWADQKEPGQDDDRSAIELARPAYELEDRGEGDEAPPEERAHRRRLFSGKRRRLKR